MAVSASRTTPLIAGQLEGKPIDDELPKATVRKVVSVTDSWPVRVAVTVDIDAPLGAKLWVAEFDNSGLEKASAAEAALFISNNIRVLIREMLETGNTDELQDL